LRVTDEQPTSFTTRQNPLNVINILDKGILPVLATTEKANMLKNCIGVYNGKKIRGSVNLFLYLMKFHVMKTDGE
jgi:hypothetical protein